MRSILLEALALGVDAHTGNVDWGMDASRTIMRGLLSARMARFSAAGCKRMGPSMQASIIEGEKMAAEAMKTAHILRSQLFRQVEDLLTQHYLLISPTLSGLPPKTNANPIGESHVDGQPVGDLRSGWFTYPTPFNLTGHPAISIPLGLTEEGIPVGIHAVAHWGGSRI